MEHVYGIVYVFKNTINEKIYVGKTIDINGFLAGTYTGSGTVYRHARKKYGKNAFIGEIIVECPDKESLIAAEKFYIAQAQLELGSHMVYNITKGGDGGNTVPDEKWTPERRKWHGERVRRAFKERTPERKEEMKRFYLKKNKEMQENRTLEERRRRACIAAEPRKKECIFIDSEGNEYKIRGIREFCKEHGLNRQVMRAIERGEKAGPHRGWSCRPA